MGVWKKRFAWFPKEIDETVVWLEYYEQRLNGYYIDIYGKRMLKLSNRIIGDGSNHM